MPIDLTTQTLGGFEALPVGIYNVQVVDANKRVGQSGHAYWGCTLEVVDGDYEGSKIFYNASFSPAALGLLKTFLVALGFEEEDLKAVDEDNPEMVMNCSGVIKTKREVSNADEVSAYGVAPEYNTVVRKWLIVPKKN